MTVRAGRGALRLILVVAGVVLVAVLGMQLIAARGALRVARQEAAELRQWQATILGELRRAGRSAKGGTAGARLSPADASEALADIIAQRDTATQVMRLGSPDRAVDTSLSADATAPASANSITRLTGRESSGIAGQDVTAIEDDSKAAWGGWK